MNHFGVFQIVISLGFFYAPIWLEFTCFVRFWNLGQLFIWSHSYPILFCVCMFLVNTGTLLVKNASQEHDHVYYNQESCQYRHTHGQKCMTTDLHDHECTYLHLQSLVAWCQVKILPKNAATNHTNYVYYILCICRSVHCLSIKRNK